MFNVNEILKMIENFSQNLKCNLEELRKTNQYNAMEFGIIQQDFQARSADKLQTLKEAQVTAPIDVKIRGDTGYYPRDGYIANLGDDSFQIVLVGVNGQATDAFTITPNTSIAIRSPVDYIKIIPQANLSAFYQVSVI